MKEDNISTAGTTPVSFTNTSVNSTAKGTLTGNRTLLPQLETAFLLWQVFPPILIIIGTIGNILSIIILCQRSMRKSGVSTYLICLAASDLLVLYTGLLRQWVSYTFYIDVREVHPVLCKLNMFMVYFSLDLSSWILVSATVKRTLSVWYPHKVKVMCTKGVFIINIVMVVFLLIVLNGHFFFGMGDVKFQGQVYPCLYLTEGYYKFVERVFPWIDLCMFCIAPFAILVIGNILIISKVITGVRTMSQFNLTSTEQRTERRHQMSSMTTMLICLNFVYLVCTLPISIFFILTNSKDPDQTPEEDAEDILAYACVNLLMYLNNSTNFITYIVSGRRFRGELSALVWGRRSRSGSSYFSYSSTVSNVSRIRNHEASFTSTVT